MSRHEEKAESSQDVITEKMNNLAEYEDLERHEQLIKFPAAIGDKLYYKVPVINEIIEYVVTGYKVEPKAGNFICLESDGYDKVDIGVRQVGRRWFRTRQEAENSIHTE